ncbi:MAG: bacteriohemerythrin [Bradyrhizobium sp.]|mgnify:CR=1 FL=1
MGLLQWEKRYSVGIEAVDHEHRELVDLINRLHDKATVQGSKLAVLGFFGDLYKAVSAHFALEEKFMREKQYDQLSQHKGDHERLLDEIRDLMEDYEVNDVFDEKLLAQRIDAWFSRHFESHDARLHRALGDH